MMYSDYLREVEFDAMVEQERLRLERKRRNKSISSKLRYQRQHKLDQVQTREDMADKGAKHIPTPEQIAERTAVIRSTWSERELLRRAGMGEKQFVEVLLMADLRPGKR